MKKNILIIGASSGIGYDLAIKLLQDNHHVYCGARRLHKLDNLAVLGAKIHKVDVCSEKDLTDIVDAMTKEVGHIDIVYANAGFAIAGPVEETCIEKVHQQFDTNVYGAARLARSVLPHMREQGAGRIVFTTSIASRVSTSMNAWYSATKHALNGMVKGLAQEVEGFNIQVVTVEPGCVQTEFDAIQLADMKNTNTLACYKEVVHKSHDFLDNAYRAGSDTSSTVNTLIKAGFSTSPRLCYQSTLDAKLMFWAQRIFGEKLIGKLFVLLIKKTKVNP
ncbi:SDR family NAD(P)-dependent oxidoreductase [Moritella marina ATCC 15381]|uniref:SDR family NAD(P)-dependent oxidoreductase n=1 Tax=Moritella marina ATCC 15381 TaxID=1202962 RepID=A0A5J6WP20_MORMI|nr:SDR family NAD(P)-dependent oxidoreductase [Moritella marina]QFI38655.1 SDR family NAD(P)-dependent oxidoreductase [Moritella marina ATCC 15381]